jgi:protein-tyrosine phosphatase
MSIDSHEALKLESVPNFRDIAGPGYATPAGPMRRGRLFRANSFLATPEDLELIARLGIKVVHDLRGQREVDLRPDTLPIGATWRQTWVPGLSSDTMRSLESANDLRRAMIDHYRGFVKVADKRSGFASLLAGIAEVDSPQIFHCSEGKDRTGWAAMLLQSLVGVSHDDVVADFLLTNDLMPRTSATLEIARAFFGDRPDEFFMPAMIADVEYLEAGLEQLEADYGDVEGYLRAGLGLDDDQLDRLRLHLVG